MQNKLNPTYWLFEFNVDKGKFESDFAYRLTDNGFIELSMNILKRGINENGKKIMLKASILDERNPCLFCYFYKVLLKWSHI